jgi:hypothetical protein
VRRIHLFVGLVALAGFVAALKYLRRAFLASLPRPANWLGPASTQPARLAERTRDTSNAVEFEAILRSRLRHQAAEHWTEFAVIVASGSIAVALGAVGLLFSKPVEAGARALIGGMLLASVLAFALAYFSIQVGAVVLVGQVTILEVAASFVIAAAQVAMPGWLGYVLSQRSRVDEVAEIFPDIGHWFSLFACFAATAALANYHAAARRRRDGLGILPALDSYDEYQRKDRRGALVSGAVAGTVWLVLTQWDTALRWEQLWVLVTVLVYGLAGTLVMVLFAQSRTIDTLAKDIGLHPLDRQTGTT